MAEQDVDALSAPPSSAPGLTGTTSEEYAKRRLAQGAAFIKLWEERIGAKFVSSAIVPAGTTPTTAERASPTYEYLFDDGSKITARYDQEAQQDVTVGNPTFSSRYYASQAKAQSDGTLEVSPNASLMRPNASGGYDVVATAPGTASQSGPDIRTAAPGSAILRDGEIVDTVPIPDEKAPPISPYQQESLDLQRRQAALAEAREARLEEAESRRSQADAEKARLEYLVQTGKLKQEDANARYDRWFDQNIKIPFLTAAEERARTAELREGARFELEQRSNAARYEMDRSRLALSAGETAIDQYTKTLPYRVGPGYGATLASAVEAIKSSDPSKIKVSADSFTYDAPDFNALADQATARVLSQISPYAQAIQNAPVTPMPATTYTNPVPQIGATVPPPPEMAEPIVLPPYTP